MKIREMSFADLHAMEIQLAKYVPFKILPDDPLREQKLWYSDLQDMVKEEIKSRILRLHK